MSNIDLSVIIVNYNTKSITTDCINSVINTVSDINYEIILVDNSSNEEEKIKSFDNELVSCYEIENKGFGNANNFGFEKSHGEYILLLNPDTLVSPETINECLIKIKENPDFGALGCKVVRPDGNLDHACRRGFPTPFNSFCYFTKLHKIFKKNEKVCRYTFSHISDKISCEVDSLTGAYMLMPRDLIERIGLFDELFFMYGEDLDLCYRIKQEGYKVYYYADYNILHKKYQSGIAKSSDFVIKQFYKSMILFYDKHYKKSSNFLVTACVYLGINTIMCLKLIKNKF